MEGDTFGVIASTPNDQTEVERGPVLETRVCPLCSSKIKLFFINYEEKLLMCENTECEFPFGYEDLQFVQVDSADNETGSISTRQNFSARSSVSGISMSDVDKLYKACESEDMSDTSSVICTTSLPNQLSQMEILKNVAPLENIHSELVKIKSQMRIKSLTDQKFIRNLYKLQDISGVQLLKPHELNTLKMSNVVKQSEVKIDIDKRSDDISVIKIELMSPDNTGSDSDMNK